MHFSKDDKSMNLAKKIILLCFILLLGACANYKTDKPKQIKEKSFYSSIGFALIYNKNLFEEGGIDKKLNNNEIIDNKLNNEQIIAMHSSLKKNTLIQIINPETSKIIETRIYRRAYYPKIFNIVLSKKIATFLELDIDNPYVEIFEVKENKTFIAKEGNIYEEERKVAEVVVVDKVEMDDLSEEQLYSKKISDKKKDFVLIIADFYYRDSAENLKKELVKKTKINKFSVKKINDNKYRLAVGPFKNFNALKSIYISLNNLGFEGLNIYRK
jgi:hypothetical protein|tara:strand:+ start:3085 stop:3897 length:813 start_codon:yes stop_codon:yes gene_type:complete